MNNKHGELLARQETTSLRVHSFVLDKIVRSKRIAAEMALNARGNGFFSQYEKRVNSHGIPHFLTSSIDPITKTRKNPVINGGVV